MPLKIQRQIVQQGFERVNRRARKRVELVYKESLRNPVTLPLADTRSLATALKR